MKRKALLKLIICTMILIGPFISFSQKVITGNVFDAIDNNPLIGATVILASNHAMGTTTDIDGAFTLAIPEGASKITVSYTGFQSKTIDITTLSEVNIYLSQGKLLDEVVVIGYGTIKREDLTGSVQSISSESFNKGAITGPQQLLAGKIPGVFVSTSGDPGGGSTIRIRGESSLNANNDPLFVIDGVPLQGGDISGGRNPLNFINPNDIETFTVLKDASATAIYGNRAAGGVIVITTKKGSSNKKLSIGYQGNYSIGKISDRIDVLNADEYRSVINERYETEHPIYNVLGDASTDWQDEIFQTATGTDHNINFSGGVSNLPYRLSLGYSNMNGLLRTDNFKRTTASINVNPSFLNNALQVNTSIKYMRSTNHFADRGAIGNALTFDPTQPVYDENSPYGGFFTWTGVNGNPVTVAPTNPVALLELKDDNSQVNRYIGNISTDYRLPFLPALHANLNLAIDKSKGTGTLSVPQLAAFNFDAITGGGKNKTYEQDKTNSLLEFYLNYRKDIAKHGLDFMAGYSWQHFNVMFEETDGDFDLNDSETNYKNDPYEYYLLSFFGRVNYTFNDRFLATFTLRNDGTSRFSPENRWGVFPAGALAYKLINNEQEGFFNNLKVRVGWGITGQEDINDTYAYLARYQFGFDNAQYQAGEEFIQTLRPNGYDSNIQWEETTTYNGGIDFDILKNKISGSVDYYQRNTSDLLNRIPVPAGTNLSNFVTTNIGNMTNKGVEINLNFNPVSTSLINWDFNVNFTRNRNEITKLTASDDPSYIGIRTGGVSGGVGSNIQIHSVGYAPYSFYVYEQLYNEDGSIKEGEFADTNNDGEFTSDDFYRAANPAPDYVIGFSSNVSVGNLDFSFAGRFMTGNYIYNNIQTEMGYYNRIFDSSNITRNIHNSAITNNVVDQASLTFSDHFLENGKFLRVDHITIGYKLDDIAKFPLRFYATVQNPILLTDYSGLDPEIQESTKKGIDDKIYPRATNFVFGIQTQF